MSSLITVQEMLNHAVQYDHVILAHQVYWAITTQNIALTADSNCLKELEYDTDKIQQMAAENLLCIGRIKLYVVSSGKMYAFYFAKDALEASMFHSKKFGEKVTQITEASRLLFKPMYLTDLDLETSLIEYRMSLVQFPAYLGHATAGKYILQRLDQQKGMRKVV